MSAPTGPLKDLKKILRQAQDNVPVSTVTPAPLGKHPRFIDYFPKVRPTQGLSELDRHQFKRAVHDVRPLPANTQAHIERVRPRPIPLFSQADELAALDASRLAVAPSPRNTDLGLDFEEDQTYLRAEVNPDMLRKLKRGVFVTQAELDLHHHNQDEAHQALGIFLAVAKQKGQRCVRIIHGKGYHSFQKEPVLKSKVRRWLQLREDVLAFCEPKEYAGGSGAVLVLLSF
jgi:DNA-nicking Smr family endonuclease